MGLADIFSPGTTHKVNDNQAAINNTLNGTSSYWQAGQLGLADPTSAGGQLYQQAANQAAMPINVNTTALDANTAQQAAIGQIYANLYANGGLAEAAQRQAGNADIANSAQGGQAGILNQIGTSRKIQGQTSAVGTQERGQNGQASTQSDFAAIQQNLAKLTMQAQASHAAHVNAINAHAVQNYLGNQQISNDQNLYDAASGARSSEAGINQNVSNEQWKAGLQIATGGLAGASSLGSTAATAFGDTAAAANTALSQGIDSANQLTLTAPSTQLKMATNSPSPYYPGALLNTYPSAANAWAIPGSTSLIP